VPDFLKTAFASPAINWQDVAVRLVFALALGLVVAWIYRRTRPSASIAASFPGTLVLLCVLIAMVTQVIGDNIARAFSLVGALSIVRFRTVVRDTQDTAFVIFAVVVGMAVGAGDLRVAALGMAVVTAAAFVMREREPDVVMPDDPSPFLLHVRTGLGHDVEALLGPTLNTHLAGRRLHAMNTAKQGLSIEVTYGVALRRADTAEALVKDLNRIDGVQSVELVRQEMQQ
jgi:uncharacterized membrane protein YhiD involved in acid resistance